MQGNSRKFAVEIGWSLVLDNLGIQPSDLLRHARLPLDLFNRKSPTLTVPEYFRLWESVQELLDDPTFPIRVVEAIPAEAFSPPLFAALCSPDLKVAVDRLAKYKPLIGPLTLDVNRSGDEFSLTLGGLPMAEPLPASFVATELVFLVNLARIGTRKRIIPKRVFSPVPFSRTKLFVNYFGVPVQKADKAGVVFRAEDADRPFLSANAAMFSFFEPQLRKQLDDIGQDEGFRQRVRACLMEAMAAGQTGMVDVADRLAVSNRTLQRRLKNEGTSFQEELSGLRETLARHYLVETEYSSAEISFLLGYSDPNSFFRAFHDWTGNTPERMRLQGRAG